MARIFISYAREDMAVAQSFYRQLRVEQGHDPWMDNPPPPYRALGIFGGEDWLSRIEAEIDTVDAALFLISKNSVTKFGIVQKEQRALLNKVALRPSNSVFLIPVVIDDTAYADIPNTRVGTIHLKDLNIIWAKDGRIDEAVPSINRIQSQLNHKAGLADDVEVPMPTVALLDSGPPSVDPHRQTRRFGRSAGFIVQWSQYIGLQRRLFQPTPVEDKIVLPSCGRAFGRNDDLTGIHALEPVDGSLVWQFKTQGDPGGISVIHGLIFGGTRTGHIFCLDPSSGKPVWQKHSDHPIDVAPCLWSPPSSSPALVVLERSGRMILLNALTGEITSVYGFNRRPWHSPLALSDGTLAIFTQEGELLKLALEEGVVKLISAKMFYYDASWAEAPLPCRFEAQPLVEDQIAYIPFSRETYGECISLIAVDLVTGEEKWRCLPPSSGSQPSEVRTRAIFGNLRHRPLKTSAGILVGPASSEAAFVLSPTDGRCLASIPLPSSFRAQWSAGAIWSENEVLLPRADGFVYLLDLKNNRWNVRIDCSRAATLGEVEHNAASRLEAANSGRAPSDYLGAPVAFVSEPLVVGGGFQIASQEGSVHRLLLDWPRNLTL